MYSFKKLTAEDYDKYYILINEFRPTTFTADRFIDILQKIQSTSEIWVLINDEDNSFIATGTIIFEHKFIFNTCIYGHIEDICVSQNYRNKGFGKQMVHWLISRATEKNCYKITLDCADNNVIFYEKCGLERRGNQMCRLINN